MTGTWVLPPGVWVLAQGVWVLALGTWALATGTRARPRRAPKHYGAGYALRSELCLTERVWPHLPLNHTVMQAKPAP